MAQASPRGLLRMLIKFVHSRELWETTSGKAAGIKNQTDHEIVRFFSVSEAKGVIYDQVPTTCFTTMHAQYEYRKRKADEWLSTHAREARMEAFPECCCIDELQ